MSSGAIIAIVVGALVVLAAIVVITTARVRDTKRGAGVLSRETRSRDAGPLAADTTASSGRAIERAAVVSRSEAIEAAKARPVAPFVKPDPEAIGVSRRQFFNRSAFALMSVSLGGFGASLIAFLWPKLGGGFGSKITVGKVDDILSQIRQSKGFLYLPQGRAWITEYPKDSLPKATAAYGPSVLAGMNAGLVALYQKCPHLGCRVPNCDSSQWFECPCHGSQYNRVGEKKGGPAPRGMDRFGTEVSNGVFTINTGLVVTGPPIGTNTTGQEAEGPHCVGGAAEGGKH
jgi:cytochrome b6-f complex iron-sulfur subunit